MVTIMLKSKNDNILCENQKTLKRDLESLKPYFFDNILIILYIKWKEFQMDIDVTEKQNAFMNSTAFETLFGGAAGGRQKFWTTCRCSCLCIKIS